MTDLLIQIKQLDNKLPLPTYTRDGDAGIDLRSAIDFSLTPFQRLAVPCGISIAVPDGYAALIVPRSGLALNNGISIVNSPGLIDSNYRGELKVILQNTDPENTFSATRGDRIAQLVIIEVPKISFEVVTNLPETNRGSGGFGSSGTA